MFWTISLLVNYKQMITKINENKVHNKLVSGATTNLNLPLISHIYLETRFSIKSEHT